MALDLILASFLKALGQLGDSRFRSVLWRGLGLTLGLFVAIFLALRWGLGALSEVSWLDWLTASGWLGPILSGAAFALVGLLAFFAMIPVASAFVSLFLDSVAEAVEEKHYPALPPAEPTPLSDAIRDGLGFLGVILGANLAALVLYAALPPAAPFIFFAMNGFLLGREYFQLAAMRRLGRAGAADLRRRHGGTIWAAGILMALPLFVPVLNLLVPVLGAATFTHIVQGLTQRR